MTDAPDLVKALRACADLYGKEFSDRQAFLYVDVLKGYDIERLRRAIRSHVQDPSRGRFFPTPADIIAALPEWTDAEIAARRPAPRAIDHKPRPSEETVRQRIEYFDRRADDESLEPHWRDFARSCAARWRNQLEEGNTA